MKPTFVVEDPNFMGLSTETGSARLEQYKGEKSVFGRIQRIYVDGELERWAGFDIADLASGDILDVPVQEAVVIRADHQKHDAQIVLFTNTKADKYAYIVMPGKESAKQALKGLVYHYEFDKTLYKIQSLGIEWLTNLFRKAFRDNVVVKHIKRRAVINKRERVKSLAYDFARIIEGFLAVITLSQIQWHLRFHLGLLYGHLDEGERMSCELLYNKFSRLFCVRARFSSIRERMDFTALEGIKVFDGLIGILSLGRFESELYTYLLFKDE